MAFSTVIPAMSEHNPTDTLICVGGPADGKRFAIPRASKWLRIPKPRPFLFTPNPRDAPQQSVQVSYTIYERNIWRAGDITRWVLVPQEQSPETTLDLLIGGYAGCHPRGDTQG